MHTPNKFELIFQIHEEQKVDKKKIVSQKIKVDGDEINSIHAVDLGYLVKSLYQEGEFYIFTCGCGDAGCAGIDEGVNISFDNNLINWRLRNPISFSGFESCETWKKSSKFIEYSFEKELMIKNIICSIKNIKNLTNFLTYEFVPEGMEWKHLDSLLSNIHK